MNLRDWLAFHRLACIASLALTATAYGPLLEQYAAQLWSATGYRLAPVLLILAALIAWRQVRCLKLVEPGQMASTLAICLAAATLGVAAAANSPEMAAASLAILGMAAALRWGGTPAAMALIGPWILACLTLRLPAGLDVRCFRSVARFDVAVAHRVLDALGVMHDVDGLSILLPSTKLWIDAAEYSLFSPWSGVVLVLAVCIWLRRSWLDSLLMLVAGCGWYVLADVLRMVGIVALSRAMGRPMTGGIAAVALDYVALVLLLSLVISTDRVGMVFGKAARLARPAKRARSTKRSLPPVTTAPVTTVTVTGVTLDGSGQLVKVVNEYIPAGLAHSSWPPAMTVAAPQAAVRSGWPLLAGVYGLLCVAQAMWLPSASDAATSRKAAAEAAMHLEMPAEVFGWQLDETAASEGVSEQPGTHDQRPEPMASWLYRRNNLRFEFSIRTHSSEWQNAAESWRDRGWQTDPPLKASTKKQPAVPVIACSETRLSKPYRPGYACTWESRWDMAGRFFARPQDGWAAAMDEGAAQIYQQSQKAGEAAAGLRKAVAGRLDVEGVVVSYRPLGPEDLAASHELFDHLAGKFERGIAPDSRAQP